MAVFGDLRYLSCYSSKDEMIHDLKLQVGKVVFVDVKDQFTIYNIRNDVNDSEAIRLDNGLYAVRIISNNEQSESLAETYTTDTPILVDVGGIRVGDTFRDVKWTDVFNKMFYPVGQETFDIETNLSTYLYYRGESAILEQVRLVNVKVPGVNHIRIEARNSAITEELYNEDVEVGQVGYVCDLTTTFLITEQTVITVEVSGVSHSVVRYLNIDYQFPTYWGLISEGTPIDSTWVRRQNQMLIENNRFKVNFTTNNQQVVFVIDPNKPVTAIRDDSGHQLIDNFEKSLVEVSFGSGDTYVYDVYRSNRTTVSGFRLDVEVTEVN